MNTIKRTLHYDIYDRDGSPMGIEFDYDIVIDSMIARIFFADYFDTENRLGYYKDKKEGFFTAIQLLFENHILDRFFEEDEGEDPDFVNDWLKERFFYDAEDECEEEYEDEEYTLKENGFEEEE